jgi:hypothetical protein
MTDAVVDEDLVLKLMQEGPISITEAAAELHIERAETLSRWIEAGKRGVKLEAFFGQGKTWMTSRQALARFFAALTAQRLAARGKE